MVKYSNGKIYQIIPICDHDEGDVYIGSTTKKYLSSRMVTHRHSSSVCNSKILFDKYGSDNCKIELLENYSCEDINELRSREGEWIKKTNCVNKMVAGRTKEQYYKDNKEKIIDRVTTNYQNNRLEKLEYIKNWNENNKEKRKQYQAKYRLKLSSGENLSSSD